jgi:hypothetical protein
MGKLKYLTAICMAVVAVLAVMAAQAVAQTGGAQQQGDQWTEAGESGAALPEMVVEATNEVRQAIEKGTFEFELDAVAVDSFFTVMDSEALEVSPVSGLQPHLNNLEDLASEQPPHLWLPDMARTPVATFYPAAPEGHQLKSWALTVTDFRGSQFKTFSGGSKVPDKLEWDGTSDGGEILRVGYPYSYVFTQTDKGTNTYNHAGASFRVPALDYRRDGNRVLELAGGEIFTREQSKLTEPGRRWLTRSTDEIRRHPYSPVRVIVTAESQALAAERADLVAAYLAEAMILPREQVETQAIQKPDLRAEMDGSVAVVIEHVD